jgi:hypothetical protein
MVLVTAVTACGGGDDQSAATTARPPATTAPATIAASTQAPVTTAPLATEPATTESLATEPPATEPATTQPPQTTAAPASEAEAAASALLRIDDFVDGWSETPYDQAEQDDDAKTLALIAECSGLDVNLIGDGVLGDTKASSNTFISPDATASVDHTVGFAPDEATAIAAIAAIGDPSLPGCYVQAIEARFAEAAAATVPADTLPPGLELGELVMERVQLDDVADDEAVLYSVEAPLVFNGQSIPQYVYLVFLRNGRVLSNVSLSGDGAPFPDNLIEGIVSLAGERAEAIKDF